MDGPGATATAEAVGWTVVLVWPGSRGRDRAGRNGRRPGRPSWPSPAPTLSRRQRHPLPPAPAGCS